ncbi:carboxypeptidase regulatory-like domain-containing protein [Priestia megaterium]|uniref:carboxypeptidase regulatory-like domain-containing protein n=1 Tax=Priestia megaterium TaxID=1404 RepID=UPI003CCC492C
MTGKPISGAGVVTIIAGSGIIIASTKNDLNGNYVITGLSPGNYDVLFPADNFASQTSAVHLAPNEIETINAALTPNPASLSGIVTDAQTGSPIAGALVQVLVVGTTIPVKSTLTDTTGKYRISNLLVGTYNILFSSKEFIYQTVSITLVSNETKILDIALNPKFATITGVVLDAKTVIPLANLQFPEKRSCFL